MNVTYGHHFTLYICDPRFGLIGSENPCRTLFAKMEVSLAEFLEGPGQPIRFRGKWNQDSNSSQSKSSVPCHLRAKKVLLSSSPTLLNTAI